MEKARSSSIATLHRLSAERRRLLYRAVAMLSVASAAVALLPFKRAIAFGSISLGARRAISIKDCVWAVEAVSSRLPWRTVCIEKGLVVQRLLRGGGVDAILHYGARHNPDTSRLEAHVWVTVDGESVIGGAEATGFAEVAKYP